MRPANDWSRGVSPSSVASAEAGSTATLLRVQKVVASLREFGLCASSPGRSGHREGRILSREDLVDSMLRSTRGAELEGAKDGQRSVDDEKTRRAILHLQRGEVHLPRDHNVGSKDRRRRHQTQAEI